MIFIFGLLGFFLILKKNILKQKLLGFWGVYLSGYLFVFFLLILRSIDMVAYGLRGRYLIPFLPPFILTASIYLKDIFNVKSISKKTLWINVIGAFLIVLLMITIHWSIKSGITLQDIFTSKLISLNISWGKFVLFCLLSLSGILFFSILFLRKKIFQYILIAGILIAFAIQVLNEVIQIKGRHVMTTREKELSVDINALKGKVLPQDAFCIGFENSTGILYHCDYPLFYEDFDKMLSAHTFGKKWNTKTMTRIINLSKIKPVICTYNYLYRYYLTTGFGNELYGFIQENHQDKLVFSNLKLNVKIYLLDNTFDSSYCYKLYSKAISYFKNELMEKPDDLNLLNYLGWTYYCSGDLDQAIETWRKKLMVSPGDADNHNNLGLAYAKQGKYQEAIIEYKNALKFKPLKDPHRIRWAKAMIYFNLAQAFEKINDTENAVTTWKEFYNTIPYIENQEIMKRNIKRLTGDPSILHE